MGKEEAVLKTLINSLLFRLWRARRALAELEHRSEGEFTEELLETLLKGMSLVFLVSDKYRKNIDKFEGRYLFRSSDGAFAVSAEFIKGKMKVRAGEIEQPNIKVLFKNPAALMNFIFSPKPDVLTAMLKQEVTLDGNLNYLYKFAYMANHLRLKGLELL